MGARGSKKVSASTTYSRRARGSRRMLESIFRLDRLLQSGGCYPAQALAAELESSPRTVQRYLELMRDRLGLEVVFDRLRGGYAYGSGSLPVPAARLSDEELLALYVAEPVLAQYEGTPLAEDFRAAWARLTGSIPSGVRARVQAVRGRLSVPVVRPSREDLERFRILFRAVMDERQVELTYFSAHRAVTSTRTVDPYALRAVAGEWYLVGYCHARERVLPFKLARVWSVAARKRRFQRPEAFDVERFFEHSFGIYVLPEGSQGAAGAEGPDVVELEFDAEAARHVRERVWHPSQELEERGDGGLVMRLRVERTPELMRWIRGWGGSVREAATQRDVGRG